MFGDFTPRTPAAGYGGGYGNENARQSSVGGGGFGGGGFGQAQQSMNGGGGRPTHRYNLRRGRDGKLHGNVVAADDVQLGGLGAGGAGAGGAAGAGPAPFARDAAVLSLEARKADERRRLAARLPAALAACDREIIDLRHRFGFKWSSQGAPGAQQ